MRGRTGTAGGAPPARPRPPRPARLPQCCASARSPLRRLAGVAAWPRHRLAMRVSAVARSPMSSSWESREPPVGKLSELVGRRSSPAACD